MQSKEFLARIEQIIDADSGSLRGTESLKDLTGWDSLAIVQFQALMDEEFHSEIGPENIELCQTVQDLMNLARVSLSQD